MSLLLCGCSATAAEPGVERALGSALARDEGECAPPQGNISESALSLFEAETSVAEAKDGSVAAVWISNTDSPFNGGVQSIGYRVWRPGCGGWGPVQLITVPGAFYHSDPTVVANKAGDFFFSFGAASGPHTPPDNSPTVGVDDFRVYVAKLPRHASSVEAPVLVSRNPFTPLATDKPWISLTPKGALAISYTQITDFINFPVTLTLARSDDDGATWTETTVDGSGFSGDGQVCTPRDGGHRVYVTNLYFGSGGSGLDDAAQTAKGGAPVPGPGDPTQPAILLRWSDDDGVTFRPEDVNRWPVDPNLLFNLHTCDARRDDVWLVSSFGTDPDFSGLEIRVGHFVEGGLTFAGDAVPNLNTQALYDLPLVVAGFGHGLDVVTMTWPFSGTGVDGQFIRIHSEDGSQWSQPQVVADNLSRFGSRHGLGWHGDYWGGAPLEGGGLDVTFPRTQTDLSTSTNFPQHVNYYRLAAPGDD